eukprot:scaffold194_cov329-Prasinococcus_capsulatus_cf.AAC.6
MEYARIRSCYLPRYIHGGAGYELPRRAAAIARRLIRALWRPFWVGLGRRTRPYVDSPSPAPGHAVVSRSRGAGRGRARRRHESSSTAVDPGK